MFLKASLSCLLLVVVSSVLAQDPLEDEATSAAILSHVSYLMRRKENVIKPDQDPVQVMEASLSLENDMRLTSSQAQMILDTLKEEMGYPVNDSGIAKRQSMSSTKWRFPIRYAFDGTHSESEKAVIRRGFGLWAASTCVSLQEASSVSQIAGVSSLTVTKGSGCWSYVGVISSRSQQLSLGSGCVDDGIAAHELGHALGLYHEQMRNDRDGFIRVNLNNIISGYESAFAKVSSAENNVYGTPYDFESVMHYDTLGFSTDYWGKRRAIESRDPRFMTSMGNRDFLSFNDIKRINYHYGCIASSCGSTRLSQACQNGGYQDPKNCAKCRCPSGWGGDFCQTNAASSGASCGGTIDLTACGSTVITSPNFPSNYPARSTCSWLIRAPSGSNLVFGFERQPSMPCNYADTCIDFVQIRNAHSDPTFNGPKFCTCGNSRGRVTVDKNQAVVHFASFSGSGSSGFRLNVYATCPGTSASGLTKECIISSSGYDYEGTRSSSSGVPRCPSSGGSTTTSRPTTTTSRATASTTTPRTSTITTRTTTRNGPTTTPPASRDCRPTADGRTYIGTVSTTISGKTCQRWDNQWPHAHTFTVGSMFPDGQMWRVKNYCRNPDPATSSGVWCFTNDGSTRREFCNVPVCQRDAGEGAEGEVFEDEVANPVIQVEQPKIARESFFFDDRDDGNNNFENEIEQFFDYAK